MKDFTLWFLEELPAFFMTEPICYFVGFGFLFVIIGVFRDIVNIRK